jgi:3-oxo-5-alpha-steroid 4-dehydrogenase 1
MAIIIDHVRRVVSTFMSPYATELKTTWIGLAVTAFAILSTGWIKASYGRHFQANARIPTVNGKVGWMLQEIFAPLAAILLFNAFKYPTQTLTRGGFLLALFLLHYSNRAVISVLLSARMHSTRVDTVLMALFFNIVNGGWIGRDLGALTAEQFVITPRMILAFALFMGGAVTNITCDYYLQSMRRKKQDAGDYVLPDWGLYKYILSPNYAAEMVEWTGFSLMMGTESSWVFLLWTVCNLTPRARTHLAWYKEKFGEEVASRKALIPGIY